MGKIGLILALLVAVVCAVHAQADYSKDGLCPEIELDITKNANTSDPFECLSDSECNYDHKCCLHRDAVYRCTEPLPSSTMRPTTERKVVKPGQCPRPRFGFGRICPSGVNCSQDGDCNGVMKCCSGYSYYCPSICMHPDFNRTTTTMRPASPPTTMLPGLPSFKPSSKPHHDQQGICPSKYDTYTKSNYWDGDFDCWNYCNSTDDCAEGELCCVENSWQTDGYRCPICMKANIDCDNGHKHGEIYREYYDSCSICQCYYGQNTCFYVCGDDDQWSEPYLYLPRVWIAPAIAASVALLLSIMFTLSVCCCLKCCCKDKQQTIVVRQQMPPMAQQLGIPYYVSPPKEERLPLTDNGYTTA